MQTLFSGLRVYIQDEPITNLGENYAYEMYVNTLIHMSTESQCAYLSGALWNPTKPGNFWINSRDIPHANPELTQRGNAIAESMMLTLVTPILSGMFMVLRLLLPNIELRFIFNFNHPNFCLIGPAPVALPPDNPTPATPPPSQEAQKLTKEPPKKKPKKGKASRIKRDAQPRKQQE